MLVMQVMLDILLGMLLQGLSPIKVRSSLMLLYGNLGVFATVTNPNCIPIGLYTIRHEAFKARIRDPVPSDDMIEVFPKITCPSLSSD